ncbi:homoserine O-acetyltransferase MetX [Ornithinimicrobium tianjinense]|uniref:Homoserine O-acetyltransferase n=1 Tax=Ornithinimicrobium tianjinense TaxID=1195761 RepID=A0A917F748_9MICO|nr:homoserine O-acetyltransferase [Ornithinimicrobium tianjinense]GGF57069.1 homoserine O-acetyltransferase [Ornithinimicrobium tianjinense]
MSAASRRRTQQVGDLTLESGAVLEGVRVSYQTWGTLNEARDNAVLVLHALTGDSHVVGERGPDQPTAGWWPGLIGPGAPIDTDEYFVVAPNVLGGCRGTTGPSSPAPDGRPYGSSFPTITVRDQVHAEALLADALGIHAFHLVVGGSVGGMRSLEWAVTYPGRVRRCVVLAAGAAATADQIAWSVPQLHAVRLDPAFHGGDYYPGPGPRQGLAIARQIAHATYRSAEELTLRFGRDGQEGEDPLRGGRYAVQSYLEHHGAKLVRRFDANSYLALTEAMNSHDVGRGRGGVAAALRRITAELTVGVVSSDRLFTPADGEVVAGSPACRELAVIDSPYGHDAFLIETEQVFGIIERALASAPVPAASRPARPTGPARPAAAPAREPLLVRPTAAAY